MPKEVHTDDGKFYVSQETSPQKMAAMEKKIHFLLTPTRDTLSARAC
jgi:hypothetical protein